MSPASDHVDEMPNDTLTDGAIEAFFLGLPDSGWEREASLATLADDVAVAMSGPVPVADHALLKLFWGAPAPAPAPAEPARPVLSPWEVPLARVGDRRPPVAALGRRLRVVAGLVLGTALALFGVGAAGATGVLPDPAQRVVARVVEAVSPFDLPEPGGHPGGSSGGGAATTTEGTGGHVSTTDDQSTVTSPGVSSNGAQGTPPLSPPNSGAPTGPGATGLDRAGQTPAGQSIPSSGPGPGAPGNPSPGNGGSAPTTGLDRARETPAATAVPPSVPGPPGGLPAQPR